MAAPFPGSEAMKAIRGQNGQARSGHTGFKGEYPKGRPTIPLQE